MSNDDVTCKSACHDLMMNLGWALDRNASGEGAELFADGGGIMPPVGDKLETDVRSFLAKRSADITTHHIVTNVVIRQIDPTTAEGRAYVMVYRAPTKPDALPRPLPQSPQGAGLWLAQFRKTAQGWRISRFETAPRLAPA